MNYVIKNGHSKVLITDLGNGMYHISHYRFIPEHRNWIPFSGETVTAEKAMEVIKRLKTKEVCIACT